MCSIGQQQPAPFWVLRGWCSTFLKVSCSARRPKSVWHTYRWVFIVTFMVVSYRVLFAHYEWNVVTMMTNYVCLQVIPFHVENSAELFSEEISKNMFLTHGNSHAEHLRANRSELTKVSVCTQNTDGAEAKSGAWWAFLPEDENWRVQVVFLLRYFLSCRPWFRFRPERANRVCEDTSSEYLSTSKLRNFEFIEPAVFWV